jgi:mono/diheme cytochrome c family protein
MKNKATRSIKTLPLIAAAVVLTIAGCGKKNPPVSLFPLVNKEDVKIGGELYQMRCAMCHGTPSAGNPPSFAPLANSPVVKGDPLALATTILYGKGHETKPGETHFFELMPDTEIERIGNYVKSAANATEVPLRAKTVERAREIHAINHPASKQTAPAPVPASPPAKSVDRLPEPDELPLPD